MNCLRDLPVVAGLAAAAVITAGLAVAAAGCAAIFPGVTAQSEPEIIVRGG